MSASTRRQSKRQKVTHQLNDKVHHKTNSSTKTAKLTLLDIADILDDQDLPNTTVWIEPPVPSNGCETDEDDASDDGGGLLDNLPRSVLISTSSVKLANGDTIGVSDDEDDSQEELSEDDFVKKLKKTVYNDWTATDLDCSHVSSTDTDCFPKDNFDELNVSSMTPVSVFELFFDDKLFHHLKEQIHLYANQMHRNVPTFSVQELKACFGILIVSGFSPVPDRGHYWSNDKSIRNQLIADTMRRDRFDQFVNNCHWVDSSSFQEGTTDSYFKIRPLIEMIQDKFNHFFFPNSLDLSYDESMIKYFGRHSCKQFIPMKPIRLGFKAFCLCAPSGKYNLYY